MLRESSGLGEYFAEKMFQNSRVTWFFFSTKKGLKFSLDLMFLLNDVV